MDTVRLKELSQINDSNPLEHYENAIISYLLQDKFNPLLYQMVMLYMNKAEEIDSSNTNDRIQQLKLKGYQLIDERYKNEEYITQNMMAFYAAMKVYELDVRDYVIDFTNRQNRNNCIPIHHIAEYHRDNGIINFSESNLKKYRKGKKTSQFNFHMMALIIHEIRHAMQYKMEARYILKKIADVDPRTILLWFISYQFTNNLEIYIQHYKKFPHEYEAIIFGWREALKDMEVYFPSISKDCLYAENVKMAKYIDNLNWYRQERLWFSCLRSFENVFLNNLSALDPTPRKFIDIAVIDLSKVNSQNDEITRFMRGEYSECLDIIPLIKDGSLKTTNLFEVINIYCNERTKESSEDDKKVYQK